MRARLFFAGSLVVLLCSCEDNLAVDIKAGLATEAVSMDADDPAIWIHPDDHARSLIFGTNKTPAPHGALVLFGLDGKTRQTVDGLDRPNNVDVEYGLALDGRSVDVAVVTERLKHRLRVYQIARDGSGVRDVSSGGGVPVFEGESEDSGEPMGIGLYRRPRDGAIFAIVSRKTGPARGYLWEYRLMDDGAGRVKGVKVREFGEYSGKKEIESVAVDDELGYVYYGDEGFGIHKWHADPDHPEAARELAVFGRTGFEADHEGIAIYTQSNGAGYIICTDQIEKNTVYHVFAREGKPGRPHEHELIRSLRSDADSTDGIEATSARLGPLFPRGVLVVMNSRGRNFLLYKWDDIAPLLRVRARPS